MQPLLDYDLGFITIDKERVIQRDIVKRTIETLDQEIFFARSVLVEKAIKNYQRFRTSTRRNDIRKITLMASPERKSQN